MSKPLFIETISIERGKPLHIEYHNQRFSKTRRDFFDIYIDFDLANIINPPDMREYRCRILYNDEICSIEYINYEPRDISTIRVVESCMEYGYKYANRDKFDLLKKRHCNSDEVLIVCDGFVKDTTIANIAFLDGKRWITPEEPLLRGTTRQRLLDEGLLTTKDIQVDEIFHYNGVALMNAMVGFKVVDPIWLGV